MKLLELFLDSSLKRFKLFTDTDTLLRMYNQDSELEDDTSLDEIQALNLYNEFLDLARLLDTYSGWTERNWTNFLMFMVQAFKQKGKATAVNCVLAALGITTVKPVTIKDVWVKGDEESEIKPDDTTGWQFITKITLPISTLYTPIVNRFLEELESLLPRLLWLHGEYSSDISVQQVLVEVTINEVYEKNSNLQTIYYSEVKLNNGN